MSDDTGDTGGDGLQPPPKVQGPSGRLRDPGDGHARRRRAGRLGPPV